LTRWNHNNHSSNIGRCSSNSCSNSSWPPISRDLLKQRQELTLIQPIIVPWYGSLFCVENQLSDEENFKIEGIEARTGLYCLGLTVAADLQLCVKIYFLTIFYIELQVCS
jgi:hypothetical protein